MLLLRGILVRLDPLIHLVGVVIEGEAFSKIIFELWEDEVA